ncbi:MAG: cupin domain-containing protein [Candidatus Eremiobacteraeota bacterium]|nr:cupin domain-containing protein [Candidatus Eremiobacteraeota bacterium]
MRIFPDGDATHVVLETEAGERIAAELAAIGVRFERWSADAELAPGAGQDEVIAAYRSSIDRLMSECGYQSVDVVRVERGNPNAAAMRAKFLNEHRHTEDEIRFFVEGRGSFYLHHGDRVYQVICARGDLISVPAGTRHWFDMGPDPAFCAVRLFENPDGWVAQFTGEEIASQFPAFEP